ncbi:hypothetical protein Pst134EB_022105 [Puccinia striiformis f. sp. tritici]|nr:hypothetical protein Pst134EB_022105 [Puccinia striiformis f. sp. tritici]
MERKLNLPKKVIRYELVLPHSIKPTAPSLTSFALHLNNRKNRKDQMEEATPPPLELDRFLAEQALDQQPNAALLTLITRFNSLQNELSQAKAELESQHSNSVQLHQKLKQTQDENRQLWTLIRKTKSTAVTNLKQQPSKSHSLLTSHHDHPTTEEADNNNSSNPSLRTKSSSVDLQHHQLTHSVSVPSVIESALSSSASSSGSLNLNPDELSNSTSLKANHSNNNKFRLSLHPAAKQPSSKNFHRHSVVPPEARQYLPGVFPPPAPNTSTLPMPPTRTASVFSSSDSKMSTTPSIETETETDAIESLSVTCDDNNKNDTQSMVLTEHPSEEDQPLEQSMTIPSSQTATPTPTTDHHQLRSDSISLAPKHSSSTSSSSSPPSRSNLSPTHSSHPPFPPTQHNSPSTQHQQQLPPPPAQQQQQQPNQQQQQQQPPTTPANTTFPHSAQPTAKRRMLTATFLPFTQIKVTNSHIRANEKSKEVISFSININIVIPPESDPERKGAKASWVVEKFYSDVLTLDHLVKSKHSKTQNKALAQLPDRALFKDHAPSKVDARKAVLQKYLQSLCEAQLKEKGDVCDFFNSNIVISERTTIPNRPGFMHGYLTKKGRNFGGWQTRFYVLDGPILEYFDTRGGNRLGHIVITGAKIGRQQPRPQEVNDDSYRHAFLIRMHKREKDGEVDHILCAETDEERDAWVDALTCYITGRYVPTESGPALLLTGGQSPDSTPSRLVATPSTYSSFADQRGGRQTSLDGTSRTDGPPPTSSSSHQYSSSSDFRNNELKSSTRTAHLRNDSINSMNPSTTSSSLTIDNNNNNHNLVTPTILEEPASSTKDRVSTEQHRSEPVRENSISTTILENRATTLDGRSPPSTNNDTQKKPAHSNTVPLTPRANIQNRHLQQAIHGSPQQASSEQGQGHMGSDGDSIITTSGDRPNTPDSQQRPKISGPMNGAPITGGYRIKPAEEKKAKFRSAFWGFTGRSDQRPGSQHCGTTSLIGSMGAGVVGSGLASPGLFSPAPRPVFGVSLQEAVSVARVHSGLELPAIVFRCIEFLEAKGAIEEEGIYRLSGSSTIIKAIKERFNTEGDFNILTESKDHYLDLHAVAGLLKQFLRELGSPILTRELHGEFLKVIDLSHRVDKVNELGRLIEELPLANYTLLRFLTAHLIHVVQNEKINKMSLRNVGIVFSPTLGMPAPLFALLLKEFDLIFNIEGDNRAPIKLQPDEPVTTTPPTSSTSNDLPPSSSSSSSNATTAAPGNSVNHTHHVRSASSVNSITQKRISRNSMMYSATGADMLMEHNKLSRSKENINEDSDSEVDYDSSSEPDEEILAATRRTLHEGKKVILTEEIRSLPTSTNTQTTKPLSISESSSTKKTHCSQGSGGGGGGMKTPSFQIDRFELSSSNPPSLPHPSLSGPRPSTNPRPVSTINPHHHHHHHLHQSPLHYNHLPRIPPRSPEHQLSSTLPNNNHHHPNLINPSSSQNGNNTLNPNYFLHSSTGSLSEGSHHHSSNNNEGSSDRIPNTSYLDNLHSNPGLINPHASVNRIIQASSSSNQQQQLRQLSNSSSTTTSSSSNSNSNSSKSKSPPSVSSGTLRPRTAS